MNASRQEVLRIFGEDRLIAVIRAASSETAERAAQSLSRAGVRLIEITLTVPDAVGVIGRLSRDADIAARSILGAGTILDADQALAAIRAGSRFLVSPILLPAMIDVARKHDVMSMPGTMTPTEMMQAAQLGADLVKIYPIGALGGPSFVTQVRRTLGHLPLVATGNIALAEIEAYLAAGVTGLGIGDPLVRPDWVEAGKTDDGVSNAKRFLEATRRRPS